MNVKIINLLFFLSNAFCFSQNKQDVYFVMDENNAKYHVSYLIQNEEIGFIFLSDRKEFEHYQKKVKQAKKNGTYFYSPESGRDNLGIYVSKFALKVKNKEQLKLGHSDLKKLRLVNYNWILSEGWKQINGKDIVTGKPLSFKNIYFLHKIKKDKYISYKVAVAHLSF